MLFPTATFAIFFMVVLPLSWLLQPRGDLWRPFIVAAGEWVASRAAISQHGLLYGLTTPSGALPDDPTWFSPNAEDTALDVAPDERSATRLPPPQPE